MSALPSAEALARAFVAAAAVLGEDLAKVEPSDSRARFAVAVGAGAVWPGLSVARAGRMLGCSSAALSTVRRRDWWRHEAAEAAGKALRPFLPQAVAPAAPPVPPEPDPERLAAMERRKNWLPKPPEPQAPRPEPERIAVPPSPHVTPSARCGSRSVGSPARNPEPNPRGSVAPGPDPVLLAGREWEFGKVKAGRSKSPPISWQNLSMQLGVSTVTLRDRWEAFTG